MSDGERLHALHHPGGVTCVAFLDSNGASSSESSGICGTQGGLDDLVLPTNRAQKVRALFLLISFCLRGHKPSRLCFGYLYLDMHRIDVIYFEENPDYFVIILY